VNVFESLREQVPIGRLVEPARGSKGQCVAPAHTDHNPSMHLYDDRVHCFACGFHGDVVDVWAAQKGFGRPIDAAVDLAREFSVRLPEISEETAKKSEERRGQEQSYLEAAQKHHTALEDHPRVRSWWEDRGLDRDLQERYLLGAGDGTTATIPFWHRGRVKGIIRRKLSGEPKYSLPAAEDLVDGHRPLFIPGPVGIEIFLVEG
jgi:DNA primase